MFYDVPAVVSDLFVLVSNSVPAAGELIRAGYIKTQANPRYERILQLSHRVMRLIRSEDLSILGDCSGLPEADDTAIGGRALTSQGVVLRPP